MVLTKDTHLVSTVNEQIFMGMDYFVIPNYAYYF